MRILIFGASGATGVHLVHQALGRGHHITAFVRDRRKLEFQHPNLTVIEGNVKDPAIVQLAVARHDAVLSALGANSMFRLDNVVIDGVANILSAMTSEQVTRFIYLSTLGVKETRRTAGFMIRNLAPTLLRSEIKGHEIKEQIIRNSNLKWSIVRAPILSDGALTGKYRSGRNLVSTKFATTLPRSDVAEFMLTQVQDQQYIRQCVSLMPDNANH